MQTLTPEEIQALEVTEQTMKAQLTELTDWIENKKTEREERIVELTRAQTKLETHTESEKRLSDSMILFKSNHSEITKRIQTLSDEEVPSHLIEILSLFLCLQELLVSHHQIT